MQDLTNKNAEGRLIAFLIYLLKFVSFFCFLYFGTLAFIGLSSKEGLYNSFVDHYIDYVSLLRSSLLFATEAIVKWVAYPEVLRNEFKLFFAGGKSITMVYSCVGYGVMSFWAAFVLANKGTFKRKISWIIGGLFSLWLINVLRLVLLFLAINKNWKIPFGWDHHTWFNIFAYGLIFLLIYLYDLSFTKRRESKQVSI